MEEPGSINKIAVARLGQVEDGSECERGQTNAVSEFGFILTLASRKDFKQEHSMVEFMFPLFFPFFSPLLVIILVVDTRLKAC